MRARVCSVQFWTDLDPDSSSDRVSVKHTDLSAFRYEARKSNKSKSDSPYRSGKRAYAHRRGRLCSPPKGLSDLDDLLSRHRLVHCRFASERWLRMVVSSGVIVHTAVDPETGDVAAILFDKFLVTKLPSGNVSDALVTQTHMLFLYDDGRAFLVALDARAELQTGNGKPQKLSKRDPKYQTIESVGGRRRGSRQISGSADGGSVLVWSKASPSDLFPWSPRTLNEDYANVHIYTLEGVNLNLKCFHRIEYDPICVSFSKIHDKIVYSVEQKTSKKGGVIVECKQLEIGNESSLEERESIRVAAPAPATCAARSPCENFLLLACSDRSVLLHNYLHNVTTTVTAAFVARTCCWWQDSSGLAVMIGGVGLQLQCWDTALAPIHLTLVGDHPPSSPVLDLSSYFRKEPTMTHLMWNEHRLSTTDCSKGFVCGDGIVLAIMQEGPIVCVQVFATSTFQGETGGGGPVFLGNEATAIARLRTMDWISQGTSCLALLHRIINSLFSRPLNQEREELAQTALGTFLAPTQTLTANIRQMFLPQLHDLCRRFFHHLMRYGRLEKAFSLAIDVGHHDLFMDIKQAAESIGATDLANEAMLRAEELLSSCGSSCSRSSCSHCSSSSNLSSEDEAVCEKNINEPVKKIDLYGSSLQSQSSQPSSTHRIPPPLPYIPPVQNSYIKNPNATNQSHPKFNKQKNSEKEHFPWAENFTRPIDGLTQPENKVLHRVVEIIPQPVLKSQSALDLFQTELQENAASYLDKTPYIEQTKSNPNVLKGPSNTYTPVYHQHPTLSGRIPSTISPLASHSYLNNNREFIPQNSREPTHMSMDSLRAELPFKPALINNDFNSNISPLWGNRMNIMNPTPNKSTMPMFNTRMNYLSSSLNQINKVGLPLNKYDKGGMILNAKAPVSVIKSSGNLESDNIVKAPGEKNKVKFSDTVTVAVVPEISRKERRPDRINPGRIFPSGAGPLDPQRELADSLPLSHPDDYLKDFTPQSENTDKEKQTKYKVVHFGVV